MISSTGAWLPLSDITVDIPNVKAEDYMIPVTLEANYYDVK